ncbi:MAG: hypothetical protein WD689_03000 [Gaiellaceae bacterium]
MTPRSSAALRALNETRVREVNEEIAKANRQLGPVDDVSGSLHVLCECGTQGCATLLEVAGAEYEAVRSQPEQFLVAPGHDQPDIERVAEVSEEFAVVAKVGVAKTVAEETDPAP